MRKLDEWRREVIAGTLVFSQFSPSQKDKKHELNCTNTIEELAFNELEIQAREIAANPLIRGPFQRPRQCKEVVKPLLNVREKSILP